MILRRRVEGGERKGSRWNWETKCEGKGGNKGWPSATRMRDHKLEGPECPGVSNSRRLWSRVLLRSGLNM